MKALQGIKAKGLIRQKEPLFPEKPVEEIKKEIESSPENPVKAVAKSKGKTKKPRRKLPKKIDPAILRERFEAWKQTEEYKSWVEMSELKKEYPDITETTDDLTGKWQVIEDKLMGFSKFFKVKTKMKELKHEHVRSFFFAREDKDNFQIDGVLAGVTKEHSDRAWHLRRKFIEIWKGFDDVHEFDENTFEAGRKKMGKDINELFKLMTP